METRRESKWVINKEIPISMLLAVLTQAVIGIIFVVRMDARLTAVEEKRTDDKQAFASISLLPAQMMRNEYEIAGVKAGFVRLESKVDQLALDAAKRQPPPN